jgi:NADH-quinone oxidoreductase subunit L
VNAITKLFPVSDFALLAVVIALPLLGAFVNGVFGKRLGKEGVRLMALSVMALSFIASVMTFIVVMGLHGEEGKPAPKVFWHAWHWLSVSGRGGSSVPVDVAFGVDAMTATMMLVVTGVGFLIHLYSSEYMKDDPGYYRFFAYLNLFIFSMLVLIMGDSLPILFVGWEGVGLCSYLLIGFWFTEDKNASAGKKAFIANRIGDFGLLCAMAMLVYFCGALTFDGIRNSSGNLLAADVTIWPLGNLPTEAQWHAQYADKSIWPAFLADAFLPQEAIKVKAATLVALSLFLGCAGKSAQIPLYVWLPDAMAGPTPVSALIHAATMVTAGVYLVARMSDVFILSPAAMTVVTVTGAATAIFAASMGLFQRDLKKVLAYSTVSQLGFMFIGVGVGAFTAGFFHVFTHAFFKACLFLGAGSVIHAMHGRIHDTDQSQDMFNMGGLRKFMPITHATYLVSCLSIAGFPFLTAGFYSKDEILWKAFINQTRGPAARTDLWLPPAWLGSAIYWVGILGATMTAFYMFRSYFLTFHGEFRGWKIVQGWVDPHAHGHGHDDHGHDDHGHDDHGHGDHETDEKLEGPVPHESPWPMTLPLVVLGAFALFAGFLGAEPLHIAPLIHKLEPIFAKATALGVTTRMAPHGGTMWLMMVPGALACFGGIGLAYAIYLKGEGRAEETFKTSWPRLYQLIFDKWRIDELYDATVIGMVDALADIFTMADQWIVDGVLARLTSAATQVAGAVLRLFHTGRVQVYAAGVVFGVAGLGWFFVQPHASVSIDDAELRASGKVVAKAAPGLGYTYKWSENGKPGEGATPDFSASMQEYQFVVNQGSTRNITVTVKNVFGREAVETITVTRPTSTLPPRVIPVQPQGAQGQAPPGQAPSPTPGQPIKIEGKDLGDFIRQGGK